MKIISKIYLPYIPLIILTGVLILGQAILQLELPKYMARIIDVGILEGNIPYIYETGIFMLLISLLLAAFAVVVSFLAARISSRSAASLRSKIFDKVTSFGSSEMEQFGTSSLITRATNDVLQVQTASLMLLRMGFFAPAMGIGALVMAVRTSPDLTWTIVVALIAILVLVLGAVVLTIPRFKILQKLMDRLNLIMNERLSGILVIRAFQREGAEEERFDLANHRLKKTNLFVSRVMSLMMPGMTLVMSYGSLLVVWAGAGLIANNQLAVGDMMAFIQYAMHVVMSFLFLTMFFIMIPRAMVSVQRISEVLSKDPLIKDVCGIEVENLPKDTPGTLVFDSVSFRYPDAEEDVLCNISFTAKPGTTTAIVGGTGSGKSTLVNLIPRFYNATKGNIYIDGVDTCNVPLANLRDLIGYIPQKGILFSGTIESNIKYAKPHAEHFIQEKSEGFDTSIAQGGTNVSGGQRQRISIARALIKNSPIYIFDDSFSALDFQTEAALRHALKKESSSSTIIVVAQRISTIKEAENIIVMDQGHLVGQGTHMELLTTCSVYRELAASQLAIDKERIDSERGDSNGKS
jgi:ATP-binding cassette subfamily B protein